MFLFQENRCVDVCLKNSNPYVRLAVEDLRKDFLRVSRLTELPTLVAEETEHCIIIEENQADSDPLQNEGFSITCDGAKIRISANGYLGTLWGIYTMRRYWKGLTAAFLLIYLSAIFTNGGPHRVYTVITAALAICGGIGMSKLQEQVTCKYRLPLQMLAILLALAGNFYWDMPRWRFTDYSYVCAVMKNQPPEVLVIYPAGDTYPVLFATGNQAADQYVLSLRDTRARRQLLLVNTAPGSIIGADQDFSQQ